MDRIEINCETCNRAWAVVGRLSFYEQQAMEARPCPQCGAYTLSCENEKVDKPRRRLIAKAS